MTGRPGCCNKRVKLDVSQPATATAAAAGPQAGAADLQPVAADLEPRTFHKRQLPCPPAIAFASPEGRSLFQQALAAGTMEGFFSLIEQFSTQDEPAYCGLASVAMVLNALTVDPRRAWKGPWRWFHEQMLDCCQPLHLVKESGVTLDQAACLARCNGAEATVWRPSAGGEQAFRERVSAACSSSSSSSGASSHLIVSYARNGLQQTGSGHFSPLGGYNAEADVVLVLDVARFKYPPHWVPLPLLYAAMWEQDPATRQSRGYMLLRALQQPDSMLFTLDPELEVSPLFDGPLASQDAKGVICELSQHWHRGGDWRMIAVRESNPGCSGCGSTGSAGCRQTAAEQQLLSELRALPLHHMVLEATGSEQAGPDTLVADHVCMLLLLADRARFKGRTGAKDVQALLDAAQGAQLVAMEVQYLKQQLGSLPDWHKPDQNDDQAND